MTSFRLNIKFGSLLYLFIIVIAAILRFTNLGAFPLTDEEALAALNAAQGTSHGSTYFAPPDHDVPQPAYEIFTRIDFQIFSANDFNARALPALAGVLLVLTPLLGRKKIGFGRAVLLGILFAICPVFVTVSRTASGISFALLGLMSFVMGLIGLTEEDSKINLPFAAVGLGLALSSGPFIFTGILALGLGLLLWRLVGLLSRKELQFEFNLLRYLRQFFWIVAIAVLGFATGLGWSINGLARFFESIAFWIKSWSLPGPFASLTILAMIPTYMPILVLIGLLGGWSAFRKVEKEGLLAIIIAVTALFVVLLFPGRQSYDLLWIALPLAYLGSGYFVSLASQILTERITPWVLAMISLIILFVFMAYLQISSVFSQAPVIAPLTHWITLLSFLVLIVVSASVFGLGWDWVSAGLSVILSANILALFISISALWHLNYTSDVLNAKELWRHRVPTAGLELLMDTLKTTSQFATGTAEGIEVELIGDAPYSLVWALREYQPQGRISVDGGMASPVVLVPETGAELILQDDYVGQTIAIAEEWGWFSALPPEFLKWWIKRQPPTLLDNWLILIRQDIAFLNGN